MGLSARRPRSFPLGKLREGRLSRFPAENAAAMRVFREAKSHAFGGQRWNRTTDTRIFRLIGLPLGIVNSHEYCVLDETVCMADGGIVEIYTRSTSFFLIIAMNDMWLHDLAETVSPSQTDFRKSVNYWIIDPLTL